MPHSNIHFEQKAGAALVTLDRPDALNALSLDMVLAFKDRLAFWANDHSVTHLILCSSSNRAFCAGGDVKFVRNLILSSKLDEASEYFRAEYLANIALIEFGKPVITLCDGIVMGGGAGLAQHSSLIVMTENTRFAMPEASIGLFPDVGASIFLSRCPKPIARLMGVTGRVIKAEDCLQFGLATAKVNSVSLSDLQQKLLKCDVEEIKIIVKDSQSSLEKPELTKKMRLVNQIFLDGSVEQMRDRATKLKNERPHDKFLAEIVEAFEKNCPLSMKLFERLLVKTKNISNPIKAIELDFQLTSKMIKRKDFVEGVRAVVIDKDRLPQWSPKSLEAVTETMLDAIFDHSVMLSLR